MYIPGGAGGGGGRGMFWSKGGGGGTGGGGAWGCGGMACTTVLLRSTAGRSSMFTFPSLRAVFNCSVYC